MAKLDIVLMGGRLTHSVSSTARETQTEIDNYKQICFPLSLEIRVDDGNGKCFHVQ